MRSKVGISKCNRSWRKGVSWTSSYCRWTRFLLTFILFLAFRVKTFCQNDSRKSPLWNECWRKEEVDNKELTGLIVDLHHLLFVTEWFIFLAGSSWRGSYRWSSENSRLENLLGNGDYWEASHCLLCSNVQDCRLFDGRLWGMTKIIVPIFCSRDSKLFIF